MNLKKASSRATWIFFASIVASYFLENMHVFEMNGNLRIILTGLLVGIIATTTKEISNKLNK